MSAHEHDPALVLLKKVLRSELADQGETIPSYFLNFFVTTTAFKKSVKGLDELCQASTLEELLASAKQQFLRQSFLQMRTHKTDAIYCFLTGLVPEKEFSSIKELLIKLRSYQENDSFLLSDVSRRKIKKFLQQENSYPGESKQAIIPRKLDEIKLLNKDKLCSKGNTLGVGATSRVYRTQAQLDEKTAVPVAVKVFNEKKGKFAEKEKVFFEKTSSPYIVFCFGLYNNIHLVLEFMNNYNMKEHIHYHQNQIPTLLAHLTIVKDIALGVLYLHNLGIVHQDLKLENIFTHLDAMGKLTVKIGDFGLSEQEGNVFDPYGSEGFFPPEMIKAMKEEQEYLACRKGDIYSFSLVMLLIMCWQTSLEFPDTLLYSADRFQEICRHTLHGGRPFNENPKVKVPSGITSLIYQSWAQDPKQRPDAVTIVREITKEQLRL